MCARVKFSNTNEKVSFLEDNKRLSETAGKNHQQRHVVRLGEIKVLYSDLFFLILKTEKSLERHPKLRVYNIFINFTFLFQF